MKGPKMRNWLFQDDPVVLLLFLISLLMAIGILVWMPS